MIPKAGERLVENERFNKMADAITIGSSSCTRCGRALKTEASRKRGMGATCAGKCGEAATLPQLLDEVVLNGAGKLEDVGLVCMRLQDGRAACNVPHVVKCHSTSGMDWGYPGSGPADLALNVLHILLPRNGDHMDRIYGEVVVSNDAARLHQLFKWTFITPMPESGGILRIETIRAWLGKQVGDPERPPPYPEFCKQPGRCAGLSNCPRERCCND